MDPANMTNTVVQLTAEQIQGAIQDRVVGLLISLGLIGVGGLFGVKVRNEVGKVIGGILAIIGSIGTIGFTLALINLSTQMMP